MYTDLKKDFFQSLNGPQIWYLVKKKGGENGFLISKKPKIKYP